MHPFLVSTALQSGMSRGQLRSARLVAPFPGIRASAGTIVTSADVAAAYALKLPEGSAFTRVTAARLWGLPLPLWTDADIHTVDVSARVPRRAPRGARVRGSQHLAAAPTGVVAGLPVMSLEQTWLSLWSVLDFADLVAIADYLLADGPPPARPQPLSTLDALDAAVASRRGSAGGAVMRSVLALARPHCWSRPETLTRLLLGSAGLPEPELNYAVTADPRSPRLDLAWPEFRFGLEYDGDHHRSRRQFASDVRRQEEIHDESWNVMRVTSDDLFRRPVDLVRRVHRRLTDAGCRGIALDLAHLVRVRP